MIEIPDQLERYGAALEDELLRRSIVQPGQEERRPRRYRVLALVSIAAVAVIGTMVVIGSGDESLRVETNASDSSDLLDPVQDSPVGSVDESTGLTVERTEVVGGERGTTGVTMEFSGPLPVDDVIYVEEIPTLGEIDRIIYTTQEPGSVQVCESVHSFPSPAEGTVDVLIPAEWFADTEGAHTSELDEIGNPAKFVVCGPHEGYYQYSIWGPESVDLDGIVVKVDGNRLSVQIAPVASGPLTLAAGVGDVAGALVLEFLDDLRRGDLQAAADRWTGYPDMGPGAPVIERIASIEALLSNPEFASILDADVEIFVNASWGWTAATPVVTVFAGADQGRPAVAVGFLVGFSNEQGEPGQMWIHRLPTADDQSDEIQSTVDAGGQITLPGVPVEGGARAYLNETEIPVVIDHSNFTTTIAIPDTGEGTVAITLSTATPELPAVQTFVLTISTE